MATGYIILIVFLVIVGFVSISVFVDWRRSRRMFCTPIPRPYRDRDSQENVWRQRYGEPLVEADTVLMLLCDAFLFNSDDRYKFAPDDRISDIYRACYPRWKVWKLGDSLEIESLMMDLSKRFGVETSGWHTDISLGEVVGLAASSGTKATGN
jgi:hypothetical protein